MFLTVAAIIGFIIEAFKKPNNGRLLTVVIFLPFTLEGVHPLFTWERHQKVTVKREILISPFDIEKSLARRLEFKQKFPIFLRLGFPIPSETKGEGLTLGSKRCVHFSGGEGQPGDLCAQITERDNNKIVFSNIEDKSHISHWLSWKKSVIYWKELDHNKVEVRWIITYDRELDPAWYFAPLERYAVRLVGEYLMKYYFEI